jgi:hypothetical protein
VLIFNLSHQVSGQLESIAAVILVTGHPVPVELEACWNPDALGLEDKTLLPQPGIEPRFLGHPSRILVTTVTERLLTLMRNVLEIFYLE